MLPCIILHTRNPRVPLRLLLLSPEEQTRTSNQQDAHHRANHNTSNSSTTQTALFTTLTRSFRAFGGVM